MCRKPSGTGQRDDVAGADWVRLGSADLLKKRYCPPWRFRNDPSCAVSWPPVRQGHFASISSFGAGSNRHSVPVALTARELVLAQLFDGERTWREIQTAAQGELGGELITVETIRTVASRLEEAGFLDGPIRRPSCLGSYPSNPRKLRLLLDELFSGPGGAGKPIGKKPDDSLRAALIPHIDYGRGGFSYTWAFREIYESTSASLFVIIGTSHYSRERFTLTRKHFETPLGVVPTDQEYIDKLVAYYGDGLFDDEIGAHLPEHSIELEVVFLQHLYENKRPIRIVPLLVGSFRDCVAERRLPHEKEDIRRMVKALQAVEAETREPICYLISGDLAHIGPEFGDDRALESGDLGRVARSAIRQS